MGVTLKWEKLEQDDYYIVDVYYLINGNEKVPVAGTSGTEYTDNELTMDLDVVERTYFWRVKAFNQISSTDFTTQWQFRIDTLSEQ